MRAGERLRLSKRGQGPLTDAERAQALANITAAAAYYGVAVSAQSWRDLF
jgi:hypothetical protein